MSSNSSIEWTDTTWNPTTGCDRVSPGCDRCYALTMAKRLKGMGSAKYQNDGDPTTSGPGFLATEHPDALTAPLRWRKPRRVFVNSMSDLFHDRFSDEFISSVFAVMAATPQHTYQILTKRHARMRSFLRDECRCGSKHPAGVHLLSAMSWAATPHNPNYVPGLTVDAVRRGSEGYTFGRPLPNVWLGVSVENQKWANTRIPALLDTPAAVRFLSCEPLLGPISLARWFDTPPSCGCGVAPDGAPGAEGCSAGCMTPEPSGIDWVIVGGESGHGARPMHPAWAQQIRDACVNATVPFHFKQWGEWGPAPWTVRVCDPAIGWTGTAEELVTAKADAEARGATHVYASWAHEYDHDLYEPSAKPWSIERVNPLDDHQAPMRKWGKHAAGRLLDGRTWDEFPAVTP